MSEIANYVGYVLHGILPPDEFQASLEAELKLEKEVAKKVAQEINRFIFYPVKPVLEQLYKMEVTPTEKVVGKPIEKPEIKEEKPPSPPGKDTYRESTE